MKLKKFVQSLCLSVACGVLGVCLAACASTKAETKILVEKSLYTYRQVTLDDQTTVLDKLDFVKICFFMEDGQTKTLSPHDFYLEDSQNQRYYGQFFLQSYSNQNGTKKIQTTAHKTVDAQENLSVTVAFGTDATHLQALDINSDRYYYQDQQLAFLSLDLLA